MDQTALTSEQNPFTNLPVDEINAVKQKLLTLSWDELKNDKHLLLEATDREKPVNASDFILIERAYFLSLIFQNSQIIPPNRVATHILEIFANFDLSKGAQVLKNEVDKIFPNLTINEVVNLEHVQNDAKQAVNGLHNLQKIALLKIAEDIYLEVSTLKKYPESKINEILDELKSIIADMNSKLDKSQEPSIEQIVKAADFLKNANRSKFEIQELKNVDSILVLVNMIRKIQEALEVVQAAYKENLVNELDNLEVIAQILEKIKSK